MHSLYCKRLGHWRPSCEKRSRGSFLIFERFVSKAPAFLPLGGGVGRRPPTWCPALPASRPRPSTRGKPGAWGEGHASRDPRSSPGGTPPLGATGQGWAPGGQTPLVFPSSGDSGVRPAGSAVSVGCECVRSV